MGVLFLWARVGSCGLVWVRCLVREKIRKKKEKEKKFDFYSLILSPQHDKFNYKTSM